jgi:hypothetical protein
VGAGVCDPGAERARFQYYGRIDQPVPKNGWIQAISVLSCLAGSGGSIVNSKGGQGVTARGRKDAQNLNFAIPVSDVLGLNPALPVITGPIFLNLPNTRLTLSRKETQFF